MTASPGLGQLGLVRTRGFSSWLTRVVTRSDWNHTVIVSAEGEVISAEPSGVQRMPVEYFEPPYVPAVRWSNFDLDQWQVLRVINFAQTQLGKPYGVLTFLWCGIARLFGVKHTPRWVLRRLRSQRSWICSQLTDSAYKAAGVHLFTDHRAEGAVVPGDYAPIFQDHGWL